MAGEQFSLCWDNFHKNMSSGMHALLESEDLVDVTLAVDGKYLKAHKMVLSVCSPYFRELFQVNPCKHPIVFMKDVTYTAMNDLLTFMYQGEVQVNQEQLTTFIKTAEALQIKGLTSDGNNESTEMTDDQPEEILSTSTKSTTHHTIVPHENDVITKTTVPKVRKTHPPPVKRQRISSPERDRRSPISIKGDTPSPIHVEQTHTTEQLIQFKMEPYEADQSDQGQMEGYEENPDDTFGEDGGDETHVDDTDYSMMKGEDEPQAGTSGDGMGESQAGDISNLIVPLKEDIPVTSASTATSMDEFSDSDVYAVLKENTATSFLGHEDISRSSENKFPTINLRNVLEKSAYGKNILNFYDTYKILDNSSRSRLVDIIIKHLYDYISQHRMKDEQYQYLCNEILELFPTEVRTIYYIPYIPKRHSPSGKGICARGRLVDKVRNILFISGDTLKHKKRNWDESRTESSLDDSDPHLNNDEINDAVTFLKHYSEPWKEVLEKWKITTSYRRRILKSLRDYFEEWPVLKDARAVHLIHLDFQNIFKDRHLKLLENWQRFYEQAIEIIGTSKIKNKGSILDLISADTTTQDTRVFCQIEILCHLLPPKGRTRINNTHWKYSTAECCDSIILLIKDPGLIDKTIQEKKQEALSRSQPFQPFMLVVGKTRKCIETIFIIVDDVRYQQPTLLKGLDLLFKIFHTFNAKYPSASEHIWTLIQRGIYNIIAANDKIFPNVMHLVNAFKP